LDLVEVKLNVKKTVLCVLPKLPKMHKLLRMILSNIVLNFEDAYEACRGQLNYAGFIEIM